MKKMFIDDERFPPNDGESWVICRTSSEAIEWVKQNGIPDYISFDHDLGGEDTSRVFIKWLTDELIDGRLEFTKAFAISVHSQNPIGAKWIRETMDGLIKYFR